MGSKLVQIGLGDEVTVIGYMIRFSSIAQPCYFTDMISISSPDPCVLMTDVLNRVMPTAKDTSYVNRILYR